MTTRPDWLPDLADVSGDRNQVIRNLRDIFIRDFQQTERTFLDLPVWWDRTPEAGGIYDRGFWHLVTREHPKTKVRSLDLRRAERLPWCGPLLSHATESDVLAWDNREGRQGRIRTYAWLELLDYVAVLEIRTLNIGEVAFLVTAYHIDGPDQRDAYRERYRRRLT